MLKLLKLKSWKLIHDKQKNFSILLSNPNEDFLTLEAQKIWIMAINLKKKLEKNGKMYQKYAKIRDVKILLDVLFNLEIIQ